MTPQCKQNAYCVAGMASNYTIKADNTVETLPLDKMFLKKGNLSLTSDGGIEIGKGISAIEVSISVYFYSPLTLNIDKNIYIYKNETNYCVKNSYITNAYEHKNATRIIDVNEGDVIYLKVLGSANDVIRSYATGTFMGIKKID